MVFEPLVRFFYANLRSSKPREVEPLVLGKRIFLDCDILDEILEIHCSDFFDPIKNSWPSEFEVTFEEAKKTLSSNPSGPFSQISAPKFSLLKLMLLHT